MVVEDMDANRKAAKDAIEALRCAALE